MSQPQNTVGLPHLVHLTEQGALTNVTGDRVTSYLDPDWEVDPPWWRRCCCCCAFELAAVKLNAAKGFSRRLSEVKLCTFDVLLNNKFRMHH